VPAPTNKLTELVRVFTPTHKQLAADLPPPEI
jgi:hypothetical protein